MARIKQKPHGRWRFRHLLLEIVVYVALILALAYAVRQLEGISLGKIEYDVPSFLEFLK